MLRGASRFINPFRDFYFDYISAVGWPLCMISGLAVGGFESLPFFRALY